MGAHRLWYRPWRGHKGFTRGLRCRLLNTKYRGMTANQDRRQASLTHVYNQNGMKTSHFRILLYG